jgi:transposase
MPEGYLRWKEIDEKLAADDVARVVERQVNQLDRDQIDLLYRGVGRTPFDPVILLKMVLYQYLKGRQSPATWHEEARLNEAMQWLGRGYQPARRTWYEFRDRIGGVIEQLHEQLIQYAIAQGNLNPTIGVQDGTFVAACASRHRMVNRELLLKRQQLLTAVIDGSWNECEELPKWVPLTDRGRLDLARRMESPRKSWTSESQKMEPKTQTNVKTRRRFKSV